MKSYPVLPFQVFSRKARKTTPKTMEGITRNPCKNSRRVSGLKILGFGKRGLLEKGSFQASRFSRDSRACGDLEFLENPQTVENKGESDHFLEILQSLEILEIPPVKRPFFLVTPCAVPENELGRHVCRTKLPPKHF